MLHLKEDYGKQKTYLKGWLYGKGYFKALKAMEFAQIYHKGKRKDGQEEFSHQVSQACYAITLADMLMFSEDTFCVIVLHDIAEDYEVSIQTLINMFGERVGMAVKAMSKVMKNHPKIPNDVYYSNLAQLSI